MKPQIRIFIFITLGLASIVALVGIGCGKSANISVGGPTEVDRLSNYFYGGFIQSIAFDPSTSGKVWASGDDGTGLFYSTNNGQTWVAATTPKNQSSYALRFDVTTPARLYAPNHFGRGLLLSINGGTSFGLQQAGLPLTSSAAQLLHDFAVNPTNTQDLIAATDSGLYVSTNRGASFTAAAATGFTGNTQFRSLAFRSDGILFAGKSDGEFGYSANNGSTFTQLIAPNNVPLDTIAISQFWIYLGYRDGHIYRLNVTSLASTTINDPTVAGSILTANRMQISVVNGSGSTSDLVLVATSGNSTMTGRYGLSVSPNSGTNFSFKIVNKSIASAAASPFNSQIILAGSGSGAGIWYSANGGTSFTQANVGLTATASVGLAVDPSSAKHLLTSYSAGGGFGTNSETFDGGVTWSPFADPTTDDGIFALDIDPAASANILAGMNTKGIWRSTAGSAGPWSQVATLTTNVDRFVRDQITKSTVYAVSPSGAAGASLYVSTNSGAAFAAAGGIIAYNIAAHPANAGEAIVVNGTDAYASTNNFSSSAALGLGSLSSASGEGGFTAVGYCIGKPTTVIVGGKSGGVYVTTNYVATGSGVTWTKFTSPITGTQIRDVAAVFRNGHTTFYVLGFGGQTSFAASTAAGLYFSENGTTWSSYSGTLYPSTLGWRLIQDPTDVAFTTTSSFYIGLWGGGPFHLLDSQ